MTIKEAYISALQKKEGGIDTCVETTGYWIFSDTKDRYNIGGCASPVAINKKTGKPVFNYTVSKLNHFIEDGPAVKQYDVTEDGEFNETELVLSDW